MTLQEQIIVVILVAFVMGILGGIVLRGNNADKFDWQQQLMKQPLDFDIIYY